MREERVGNMDLLFVVSNVDTYVGEHDSSKIHPLVHGCSWRF